MKRTVCSIAPAAAMLVLILDTKTAIGGAQEGLMLCIATVIPALLPFFILSSLLTAALTGAHSAWLRLQERLLRMPEGSSVLFLIGILGGYPAGAMAVTEANRSGRISDSAARRLLGFCSNAGPSFIFGIAAAAFEPRWVPWMLWGIHILSAALTAHMLPFAGETASSPSAKSVTLSQALDQSLKAIGRVCGWIIVFRVVIAFCNRWFLWVLDTPWQIAVNGLLELTIGCTALGYVENAGLRLILCSAMLGFGGLCVAMQTASVCGRAGTGYYLPGKLLQGCFSVILTSILQFLLLSPPMRYSGWPAFFMIASVFACILGFTVKKGVAFRHGLVYNPVIRQKREAAPCSSESASANPAAIAASAQGSTASRSYAPSGARFPRITSA